MRYGSVCSGIEAATVAWHPLGWVPAFFAEIERFPSEVLAHHYGSNLPGEPHARNGVPNYGDMTRFEEWPDADIDVLVGGTPCQDYSVAGRRLGMAGDRGQLTLTYVEIAARYRPGWVVWENVPGVLSSNDGRDFARFLGDLSGTTVAVPEGGWQNSGIVPGIGDAYGLAFRVLDAQYVRVDGYGRAVPQRRRRVFVVGYLGDWRRAAAVLFEPESVSGHPAPRREAREGAAAAVAPSLTASGRGVERPGETRGQDPVVAVTFGGGKTSGAISAAACLTAKGQRIDFEVETFVATRAPALSASNPYGDHESREGLLVAEIRSCSTGSFASGSEADTTSTDGTPARAAGAMTEQSTGQRVAGSYMFDANGATEGISVDVVETLRTEGFDASKGGTGGGIPLVPFDTTQITSAANRSVPKAGDPCHPLAAGAHAPAIAIQAGALRENPDSGPDGVGVQEGISYTLEARAEVQAVASGWAVRRLTPTECERLQGFPDGYTAIARNGKLAADGPRYKVLGNSMAGNVMRWIGRRIAMIEGLLAERSSSPSSFPQAAE